MVLSALLLCCASARTDSESPNSAEMKIPQNTKEILQNTKENSAISPIQNTASLFLLLVRNESSAEHKRNSASASGQK